MNLGDVIAELTGCAFILRIEEESIRKAAAG